MLKEDWPGIRAASRESAVGGHKSRQGRQFGRKKGNENYARSGSLNAHINVEYARNDAGVFREYTLKSLGVQDENTHISYLIPVDVDATNLTYAINLSDLYWKLAETNAQQITIFLDACFYCSFRRFLR